jgi:vacuolar protein sorting-associated protein 35
MKNGKKMKKLYEAVQHSSRIVPRLYLMITVGDIYILSKESDSIYILYDLFEMCKGCQHPTRGLFLRYYLSLMSKDKLPDIGGEYESDKHSAKDSIKFVMDNFNEMVHLFVRLRV